MLFWLCVLSKLQMCIYSFLHASKVVFVFLRMLFHLSDIIVFNSRSSMKVHRSQSCSLEYMLFQSFQIKLEPYLSINPLASCSRVAKQLLGA